MTTDADAPPPGDNRTAELSAGDIGTGDISTEDVGPTGASRDHLRVKVSSALRWSFFNSVFIRVSQLALSILLARLIAPEQFGVYAAALVVINIILSISELGVSVSLVQHEGDISDMAPTVTTLSWASGAALAAVCFLGAPYFASALGAPEASGVIRLMSLAVVAAGGAAVPGAILQRNFRQDHKMLAEVISFVVGTTIAVVLALMDFGPWALAWSRVATNVVAALVMVYLTKERFWPGWDAVQARIVLSFGLPLAGSSLLIFVVLNVDYMVVGSVLGPVALGYYLIAFNLSSWPVNAFSTTIRSVSLAAFSRLRSDPEVFRESFGKALASLMALTIPACILLAVLAQPLLRVVYGTRWLPAAGPLAILSILGALRVALELAYDYLAASGKTRPILWIHLLWLAGLVPALIIGARVDGLRGVGWGHVVVVCLLVTPAYLVALKRIGVTMRGVFRPLLLPLIGGVAMFVVIQVVERFIHVDFWILAVGGVTSLATYTLIVLPMRKDLVLRRTSD